MGLAAGRFMVNQIETIALLKKECYQAAVKMVDLTSDETNFVRLHELSTALSNALFEAATAHLGLEHGESAAEAPAKPVS